MLLEKNKIIFFHIPKTGGNSIANALFPYSADTKITKTQHDGLNRFELKSSMSRKLHKHSDFGAYYKVLGPKIFSYQKFAVLRDPFERITSFYFSPHRNQNQYNEKTFFDMLKNMKTFSHFVSGGNFDSIQTCLDAGTINKIISFDTLSIDLEKYLLQHDIKIKLPHVNKSINKQKILPWTDEMVGAVTYKFFDEIKYKKMMSGEAKV